MTRMLKQLIRKLLKAKRGHGKMDSTEEIIIQDFYQRERTEIGRSVIRQLAEALNIELIE